VIHGLASALAERHDILLLHLGTDGDVDPALAARCAAVDVVEPPRRAGWSRRVTDAFALARGRSLWAADSAIPLVQRQVRSLLRRHQPDVVQVEHTVLGDALAAAPERLRVVTVYDPASSGREHIALRREGPRVMHRLDAVAEVRQERRVLALADAAVVLTERDRGLLAPLALPRTEVVTIPTGWTVPAQPLDPVGARPPTLLFVGNFVHPPNVDAALRLAQRILPLVRSSCPEVTLELVGGSPPPEVHALAGDRVLVAANVASVAPHLDHAAVVVVPIAIGGGVRVKVLEALAAGKAVVASERAAEGIGGAGGKHIVVAEGDQEMAAAIVELVTDEPARRRLAGEARAWAERELSWSATADRYDELYDRLEFRRNR
jgi:glycosyltransferase involved in cell wall biosynthesis